MTETQREEVNVTLADVDALADVVIAKTLVGHNTVQYNIKIKTRRSIRNAPKI